MQAERDKLVPQSSAQSNPYLCRPEDFILNEVIPGGGQRGNSSAEHKKLIEKTLEDPLFSKYSGKSGRNLDGRQKGK